jgi:hypothetical protein
VYSILQHYITKYEIRNRDDMHSNKSDIISRKRDDINANRNFATQILRNELSPNMQNHECYQFARRYERRTRPDRNSESGFTNVTSIVIGKGEITRLLNILSSVKKLHCSHNLLIGLPVIPTHLTETLTTTTCPSI